MATYTDWNNAIAKYLTANVPSGVGIFLTLNDDTLQEIAANFLERQLGTHDAATDFVYAVRAHAVRDNGVQLSRINSGATGAYPLGLAFLGLMVLAAHRMDNNEAAGINERNYFLRLTQLLGVPSGVGNRPAGLATGSEQQLWLQWNRWLQTHGWQPTARPGPEGTRKYLNYVLTQALVRDGDKSYLQAIFLQSVGTNGISRNMDEVQLAGWLQRTNAITRRYLREGFRSGDPRRAAAFYEAAYRVFQATSWDDGPATATAERSRIINAGLIRFVSLSAEISYRMFVPQPTNWIRKPLAIRSPAGQVFPLRPDRLGHFKPLETQQPFVAASIRYTCEGDPLLDAVIFPIRDFWILTPDPEDPTGACATWEKFPNLLGQKFTLICSTDGEQFVQCELEKFRAAKLLNWDDGPEPLKGKPVQEYRGCMILSSAWDGVVPSDQCVGLYEALKPKQFATITLAGGIRAPDQNAWLVNHPPQVKIYGFEEQFGFRLVMGDEQKLSGTLNRQDPHQLDRELSAGIYTVEVDWNGQLLATRSFRLINWDDIDSIDSMGSQAGDPLRFTFSGRALEVSGAMLDESVPGKECDAAHA